MNTAHMNSLRDSTTLMHPPNTLLDNSSHDELEDMDKIIEQIEMMENY